MPELLHQLSLQKIMMWAGAKDTTAASSSIKILGKTGTLHKGELMGSGQLRQDETGADKVRRAIPELLLSGHHPASGQRQQTEHARLEPVPPSSLSGSIAQHPLPSLPPPDPANPSNTLSSSCQLLLFTCNVATKVGSYCHERLVVTKLSQGNYSCTPARQHYHGR